MTRDGSRLAPRKYSSASGMAASIALKAGGTESFSGNLVMVINRGNGHETHHSCPGGSVCPVRNVRPCTKPLHHGWRKLQGGRACRIKEHDRRVYGRHHDGCRERQRAPPQKAPKAQEHVKNEPRIFAGLFTTKKTVAAGDASAQSHPSSSCFHYERKIPG